MEHEPAVTVNHQIDVKSEITTSAELSAQLKHTASIHSTPTFITPPPCTLPSSLTHLFRSLSPLSSLGDSPPALQEEINAESGPGASIEELSVLAKKDLLKIMISKLKLKCKLESLESVIQNGKPKSRQPQKRKSKSLAVQEEVQMCQWPTKSEQDGSFQQQFVQCDNCDLWYHFGCAGFSEGDPHLEEPDSVFICLPCWYARAKTCACPDCSLTKLNTDSEEYVIKCLVGRKTIRDTGYLFLVKWEGYPITQASWIPNRNIGGVSQIFDHFVADVTTEGIDLNLKGVVLLEEARHGRWNI
ncbi:uncharacterized protein F5891DRAFT_949272 [Suillus fuscotomentosus]|uniref:Chromo domain-containing protein n=1 Tax=Suillus fuscotomentosus TaxID=1912939 RepID=A0AAD4E9J9_9AGAM|nr:uncharacterized protein F5891DRAFT_949272 [Suillus fuscotomentosus]KAG1902169.1 hypothetical protein F5891DRAFT_949272 [Suillus fuscotomentosus]